MNIAYMHISALSIRRGVSLLSADKKITPAIQVGKKKSNDATTTNNCCADLRRGGCQSQDV
jgi:hypothetical protein